MWLQQEIINLIDVKNTCINVAKDSHLLIFKERIELAHILWNAEEDCKIFQKKKKCVPEDR